MISRIAYLSPARRPVRLALRKKANQILRELEAHMNASGPLGKVLQEKAPAVSRGEKRELCASPQGIVCTKRKDALSIDAELRRH